MIKNNSVKYRWTLLNKVDIFRNVKSWQVKDTEITSGFRIY